MSAIREELRVGIVSISDRASGGVYKDEGIPALKEWLGKVVTAPAYMYDAGIAAVAKGVTKMVDQVIAWA